MSIRVQLKGFLSHNDSEYMFPAGCTHVIGPNGSGKSDIYRAIQWALYAGKADVVHPIGTSNTVSVKVSFGDGTVVKRTAVPNTVTLKRLVVTPKRTKTVKTTGIDAITNIEQMFGSKRHWLLCSHISSHIHPFIAASGPQKVEMINELIGSDENIKKKLASMLLTSKQSLKEIDVVYTKKMTEYEVIYKKTKLDTGAIMSSKQTKEVEIKLEGARAGHQLLERSVQRRAVLESQIKTEKKTIKTMELYTKDKLRELELDRQKTLAYTQVKARFDAAAKALAVVKKTCCEYDEDYVFTNTDITNAIILESKHADNKAKCKVLAIQYTKSAIDVEIIKMKDVITSSEVLVQIKAYDDYVKKMKTFASQHGLSTEKRSTNELELLLAQLERNIEYNASFQQHQEVKKLMDARAKLVMPCGDVTPSKYIKIQTQLIKDQYILDEREAYLKQARNLSEYESLFGAGVDTSGSSTIYTIVSERLVKIVSILDAIKRSETVLACPHCTGLFICGEDIVTKFEGEVVKGNTKSLRSDLAILTKLSSMRYPDLIPNLVRINTRDVRASIAVVNDAISLDSRLAVLREHLTELPDDVEDINTKTAKQTVLQLKTVIGKRGEYQKLEEQLQTMARPASNQVTTPSVLTKVQAEKRLRSLKEIQFHILPKPSSEDIKVIIEVTSARLALSETAKPESIISDKDVITYATNLSIKDTAVCNLDKLSKEHTSITTIKSDVEQNKMLIANLEEKIRASKYHRKMKKDTDELNVICDEFDAAKQIYANIVEFKDIVESDSKYCIAGVLSSIEIIANNFLESVGTVVRIELAHEDKIKIVCSKDSVVYGNPSKLSSGEFSLVSFSLTIAFNLQSKNNILILDEATDKLSVDNKDKCIELLLDIATTNNKTLLLTDHHCHSGDFDLIIDLTDKYLTRM